MSLFSQIPAWRCVDWVNRILRIGPKTFCIGFPWACLPLWESNNSKVLRDTTHLRCNFHNSHCLFVVAFYDAGTTLVPCLHPDSFFTELTFVRMPILTKRSRPSTFQIVSARLSKNDPRITFALDSSFPRCTSTSCRWWLRRYGGIWVRFLLCTIVTLMPETARVSLRTLAFSLSTGSKYLVLLHRHSFPFDSWPLLLFQLSRTWRQSFVIEVSDLYFSSPSSATSANWESILSDESPCRTILIRFWVVRTHVF